MGKLIVFEGLDGSGKETQTKILAERLIKKNLKVKRVEYPNYKEEYSSLVKLYLNGKIYKDLFKVNSYAAAGFYASDHYLTFEKNWKEKYLKDYIIIADRYVSSNAIYQMAKLKVLKWNSFLNWLYDYEFLRLKLPKEDFLIYLDVDLNISKNLIKKRKGEKDIHEKNFSYLEKCQKAALFLAKKFNWHVLKCCENGKMLAVEEIAKKIELLVNKTL